MTSATDVITYIGVPLAVLGVLPIFYTFFLSILTQRHIRSLLLHHGHKPLTSTGPYRFLSSSTGGSRRSDGTGFTIRSSPMSSQVEVELPTYTIAPLERSSELYWKLDCSNPEHGHGHAIGRSMARVESTLSMIEEGRVRGFLRGGSWRTFHWKKLVVGRKLYRIQYADELREPPSEIDFSGLVHFLLDWGAVPDESGWGKLKSGGLWTPGGTVLLGRKENQDDDAGSELKKKAAGQDWVLRTSVPDESDGVLCLNVRWSGGEDGPTEGRGAGSLPPGWGRLTQPEKGVVSGEVEQKGLAGRIEEFGSINKAAHRSESLRFHVDGDAVTEVFWEHSRIETGLKTSLWQTGNKGAATWFTSAASALLQRKDSRGGLWGFEIPSNILTFTKQDSIPCGVMVILGIIAEIDTPAWQTEEEEHDRLKNNVAGQRHHQRFLQRMRAEQLEKSMPEAQARVARMNRMAEERQQMMDDMNEERMAREERAERRIKDAIASPKMGNKAVAEACLAWLIDKEEVGREWTVANLAEAVLYLMAVDQRSDSDAAKVVEILEEWMGWAQNANLKKSHINFLENRKVEFCFAAALVALVQEAAGSAAKAGADMIECLKLWRKVRLG
jgi:hypothetical protein